MLTVADIWEDAKIVFGNCSDAKVYAYVSDAIEILSQKGSWDPLMGYLDICCSGRDLALPSEVETPHGVWIDGNSSMAHDEMFAFHLNGPGQDWNPVGYHWLDSGTWPTYRDLSAPAGLYAAATNPADHGKTVLVRAYDEAGDAVTDSGFPGLLLPIQYGTPVVVSARVARITRIEKPVTAGRVKLFSADFNASLCNGDGQLIGDWQYWETVPQYRRIRLSRSARWVRVMFRRKTHRVSRTTDLIPLHSRQALIAMFRAIRAYNNDDIALGLQNESQALRWLSEKEDSIRPPGAMPIQVSIQGSVFNSTEDSLVS